MSIVIETNHIQNARTFLDQKLESSSMKKSTPPIGAPKAAAKLSNKTNEI